jgi:hypothetical protein
MEKILLEKLTVAQPFKKIPHLLLNLEVPYYLHTSHPLIPILSQFNPVYTSDLQQNFVNLTLKGPDRC